MTDSQICHIRESGACGIAPGKTLRVRSMSYSFVALSSPQLKAYGQVTSPLQRFADHPVIHNESVRLVCQTEGQCAGPVDHPGQPGGIVVSLF